MDKYIGCQQIELNMKYLHTMLRIKDEETSLKFFVDALGLKEIRRIPVEAVSYTHLTLPTIYSV